MSATERSSHGTAEPALTFASLAPERLDLPIGLFDEHVTAGEETLSLFMPIIVCKDGGGFRIIDGCKRYAIFRRRGDVACACGIIETEMSAVASGLLRIGLNAHRALHAREKFLFIGWLKKNLDGPAYHEQVEKLRLAPNERHEFEQLLKCKPWLIDAVLKDTLDATVAPEMDHLPQADAQALITLFAVLSFSRQMQRELAEWLPEIAFLGKISLPALLASEPIAGILADTRQNNPQKASHIHDYAHATRFPLFSAIKKQWTEESRRINPDPSKITLHPSPNFEKNTLEIRIKAEDAETAAQLLKKLAGIDRKCWQRLIDPTAEK